MFYLTLETVKLSYFEQVENWVVNEREEKGSEDGPVSELILNSFLSVTEYFWHTYENSCVNEETNANAWQNHDCRKFL